MANNNYSGQLDPFHMQSYGHGMPTPITYPNQNVNSSVPQPPPQNMFFPPMNFSVPPPTFPQMNVISSVQHQPPPPPPPQSQPLLQPSSSILPPALIHQHTAASQSQHSFPHISQNVQSHVSNQIQNDKRREFHEKAWHESQPSMSRHRKDQKMEYSATRRPYESKIDTSKAEHRDRYQDTDKSRDRDRDRDRDRFRERDRNRERHRSRDTDSSSRSRYRSNSRTRRERIEPKREKTFFREKERAKVNEKDRKKERQYNVERKMDHNNSKRFHDDRRSVKSDDRRIRSYDSIKSKSRSRSRSRSTYSHKHDKSNTYESKHRSTSILSSKPETSPTKLQHIENKRQQSVEISTQASDGEKSERARILEKWRSNYCETSEDITRKLQELSEDNNKECWIRSSPADLYYKRTSVNEIEGTARLDALCTLFKTELVDRGPRVRKSMPGFEVQPKKRMQRVCRHKSDKCSSSESSDDDFNIEDDCPMEELTKKIKHPYRLHADLWHNESGEMNDGPLCRCSAKSRRSGIRHGIYPGEGCIPKCNPNSNNAGKLYHYKITVSPPTNFLTKTPTMIKHDEHEFLFEGFSLLSHSPIAELPTCSVIRFNIEYKIMYFEEKMPENFTIRELDIFSDYLFTEILEMLDFSLVPKDNSCACFHFLPRFVRDLPDNGKEVLSMSEVIRHLLDNSGALVADALLKDMRSLQQRDWQDYVDDVKGMVVTNPGMKPCSVRVDQLDRNVADLPECIDPSQPAVLHPVIVHFGVRPPQLSYAGNQEYQKSWREYVKFRHLVANMSKPSFEDKRKLESKESRLQEMRTQGRMKRNVTIAIVSRGFYRTGIMCDIIQHALLIPVLTTHLRFHQSLNMLEKNIDYKFKNRYLLQLALTHPSYKENFGTNPDHARNSLTNCGIRQPEYGDRKIHYLNTRKRGINTLINIMSRFGRENETDSSITHNERLEFLGDAVVEFLTSIHLFFMFPDLEEGGLATYRAAIVQNQHLAVLAKKLHLDEFMLYAHGSDLCHELELRHAMANCFEALMGALLLDGGIEVADKVFANTLFMENSQLKEVWVHYPPHPLQDQEPLGDRQWIDSYTLLKDLTDFEDSIGIKFRHIRLLARAFTDRSIGFTHLTLGSNQRLEFLGDTVLQLICSEYLYRHFPEHHEGHLSLLRSSLVNNRTQAVVCDDLGMTKYAIYSNPKSELKTKDRADLLEAFLGALYVDKGLQLAEVFCQVCLFPRLQMFIMNQDWNDPKSKLQQCCLTLRTMDGGEPDIPIYKVIECTGPTNTRVYKVAVYFRGKRLASSCGHSIQQAEMEAAKKALENSSELFPQLDYQKRVMAKTLGVGVKQQKGKSFENEQRRGNRGGAVGAYNDRQKRYIRKRKDDNSNLPKQYRVDHARSNLKHLNNSHESTVSDSDDSSQSSYSECSSHEDDQPVSDDRAICKKNHQNDGKCQSDVLQKIEKNADELNSTEKENNDHQNQENEQEQAQQQNKMQVNQLEQSLEQANECCNDVDLSAKDDTTNCSLFNSQKDNTENNSDTDVSLESGEIL